MSELPNGWFSSRLEDIVEDVSYGFTASSSGLPIGPKMLRITDIQDRKVDWNSVPYCNANSTELSKYRLKGGDLVFARTGATVGKSFLIQNDPENAVYASYLIRVRAYPEVDNRYLSYYFQSPDYWEQITEFSAGVGQPNVNGSKLKNLILPLAPLNEQKRIADKLDRLLARVDAAKARLDKIPALLKRLRQAILAAATTGKLTEEWRSMQVLDVLNGRNMPSGWQWVSPDTVKSDERHALAIGPFGSNLKVKDYKEKGIPLVFVREIRARTFGGPKTKYITADKAEELFAHSVLPGDVLITKMGDPPGDVAIYPEGRPLAVITADCIKLRVNYDIADAHYISYVIESPNVRERLKEITAGVAQQKISLVRFRNFVFPLAPLNEQKEIVRRVEELFAIADRIEAQYRAARARVDRLMQSLLAKAFRGELVPQDPNDEPATALLERIRVQRAAAPKPKRGRYRKAAIQELPMVAEEQGSYTQKMSRRSQSGKKSK
jgi:type I restriction enzyme S subunit